MQHKLICFRCKKEIGVKENYYRFCEFVEDKIVSTNYAHRKCWDDFLKKISDTTEAMSVVRGLKNQLINMGMLPKEQVEIKC